MNRSQIARTVTGYIRETFLFDGETKLDQTQSLIGTGIVDSTGTLELIVFLENEFGVAFDDSELVIDNFECIDRIARFVEEKLAARNSVDAAQLQLVATKEGQRIAV